MDTTAASRRCITKQKQRIDGTKRRAMRIGRLAKLNKKCKRIAIKRGKNDYKNKVSFSPSLASSAQLIVSLSRLFSIGSQRNTNAYWPPLSHQPNRLEAKDREYFSSCYGRFLLFAQNNFNTCPALRSQEAKRAQNLRGLTKRGRSKGQRKGLALRLNSKRSSSSFLGSASKDFWEVSQ